ncbi:MAG: nicotinamide mononucleotide transporter [Myxococcales bacterium]|nr:nicotinamide mononucleotide transporter [Myxococcales bacterium]
MFGRPVDWMTYLEWSAALCGVVSVVLIAHGSAWGFVAGFAMGALYVAVFFDARLYADSGFQAVYALLQLRGLYLWRRGRGPQTGRITRVTRDELAWGLALATLAALALGAALTAATDAALPYADSAAVTFAVMAQVWLNRRRIENWIAWVLVDVWAAGVYLVKDLRPTAALFLLFAALSAHGWRRWSLALRAQEAPAP